MKREAVKKLSQMIKDRDFEIDALNKKNETLLQVGDLHGRTSPRHSARSTDRPSLVAVIFGFGFFPAMLSRLVLC